LTLTAPKVELRFSAYYSSPVQNAITVTGQICNPQRVTSTVPAQNYLSRKQTAVVQGASKMQACVNRFTGR